MSDSIEFRIDGLPSEEKIRARSREICKKAGETEELIRTAGWKAVRDAAGATLREELAKQDGLDWLSYAWTKSQELKTAANETLDGVPERCVKLASHSISQEVLPTVTLSCAGLELEMEFTLDLTAEIECIDLVVHHGCLVALRAGRLTPSAALSFKGIEIHHIVGDPIDLPEHRFSGGGLRIADERTAAPAA
jgi:hypothetical protein